MVDPHRPHLEPLTAQLAALGFTLAPVPFTDDAEFDLFGDGTLTLIPTPGHSPGSMSLLITAPDAPPLLLVGDVTYDPALLWRGVVPDVGDRALQLKTASHLARLRESHPDLIVLAAHDPHALATLHTPPPPTR